MTQLRAAPSSDPARWLLAADVPWWTVVRFGPPGFDAYARIEFAAVEEEPDSTHDAVSTALALLDSHTTTPDRAYAALWEGCVGQDAPPDAPKVPIPERTMVLYTGRVSVLHGAVGRVWPSAAGAGVPPHLVWPADHAWCLACEVDEEVAFTVGCSDAVYAALEVAFRDAVHRVPYGADVPIDHDG